jgi:hypothetical protein
LLSSRFYLLGFREPVSATSVIEMHMGADHDVRKLFMIDLLINKVAETEIDLCEEKKKTRQQVSCVSLAYFPELAPVSMIAHRVCPRIT